MQTMLLALVAKAMPILALVFVSVLLTYKLYKNVRSRYSIEVNCWFCNENTRVPYPDRNCWTCPFCEQYNGFNADGDYNRDILVQRDCSESNLPTGANAYYTNELSAPLAVINNGLCDQCNEAQRLKVEKLAHFEPKNESRFDQEHKLFLSELEKKYSLCSSCERHVCMVLHEKKKMVLGSKLLNFIMKGAALLKQPYFERLALAQQQRRVSHFRFWMMLLTWLNILCLLCSLPTATREQFNGVLGKSLAYPLYFVYSHALTLLRLLFDFARDLLTEQAYMDKLLMFARTFGKLVFYSLSVGKQSTFCSCYTSLYPYAMIALSFICNVSVGLKFTRFTLLLVLWSVYANGSMLPFKSIDGITLLASVLTLILLTGKRSIDQGAQNESTSESFHRLCTDECISDEETISMLSQQLSYSASNYSNINPTSNQAASSFINGDHRYHNNSNTHSPPSVLSLDPLRLSSHRSPVSHMSPSLAPSCRPKASIYATSNFDNQAMRNNYGMHMNAMQMDQSQGWQRSWPLQTTTLKNYPPDQCLRTHSANNLLFPSRLQTQEQHQRSNGDICAWVDATSSNQLFQLLQEPTTANFMNCCYNPDPSPTSSQSSGFESQMGNNQARQQPHSSQQFLGLPAATSQQQQFLQKNQEQQLSNSTSDYVYSGLEPSQRQQHIPATLLSPYSTHSEMRFGRTAAAQPRADLRPGDLLRKWMGRNDVDTQKR